MIKKAKYPVLKIYGAEDENDNVPVKRSVELIENLIAGNREIPFALKVCRDSGHALFDHITKLVKKRLYGISCRLDIKKIKYKINYLSYVQFSQETNNRFNSFLHCKL